MLLPVSIANECDWSGTFADVGRSEVASDDRLNAEYFQEIRGNASDHGARGLRAA